MYHQLTYCCVWDAGNGLVKWVGTKRAPPSAQVTPGQMVTLPLTDGDRRNAISEYRQMMAAMKLLYQRRVFLLSPRGQFWNIAEPLDYDDSVREVAVVAKEHDFLVLDSEDLWLSIRPFMQKDGWHFNDARNVSTGLAYQWQNIIEVVDHAAYFLHSSSLEL